MSKVSEHFVVDYRYYQRNIKDYYKKTGFNAKTMTQFLVRLPLFIPVDERGLITLKIDNDSVCTFLFSSIKVKDLLFSSSKIDNNLSYYKTYTIVEMMYSSNLDIEIDEAYLNHTFDKLFNKLNEIIISFLIETKDSKLYRLNLSMLEFSSIYRVMSLSNGKEINSGLFMLNFKVPADSELVTFEQVQRIVWFTENVVAKQLNPFLVSEELMLSAFRQEKNGSYKEAILLAQSSVESFLRSLFRLFLLSEGNSEKEVEEIIENTAFISMIKKKFNTRIGGNWNPESTGEVGEWYRETYKLRNRIAHGGLEPNSQQADIAIQKANQLRRFTIDLLKTKSKKYSEIFKYFQR